MELAPQWLRKTAVDLCDSTAGWFLSHSIWKMLRKLIRVCFQVLSYTNIFIETIISILRGGGWGESLIIGSSLRSVYLDMLFHVLSFQRIHFASKNSSLFKWPSFHSAINGLTWQQTQRKACGFLPNESEDLCIFGGFWTFGGSWLVWKGCKCDLLSNICPSMSGMALAINSRTLPKYILKVHQNAFLSLLQTRSNHYISMIF